jgi:eukaryotic-like serine/threonine-protein kinase
MSATGGGHRAREYYEFGPYRVDPEKELLLREGQPVPLTPKAFQVLLVLLQRNPETVTKDELMQTVWPDSFVEEANLSRNVFLLRKALGEGPTDHRFVITVTGKGYRFAEEVRRIAGSGNGIAAATSAAVKNDNANEKTTEPNKGEKEESKSKVWTFIAIAVLLAIAGGAAWRLRPHKPLLTEKDTIVVADYANMTGENVFDEALQQGLAIELEQSPFLALVSDQQIQLTLKMMGRQPGEKLTPGVALELCQRMGSAAVLNGSISQIGKQYLLTLKAVNCANGELLASAEARAPDKDRVLDALGETVSAVRTRLGESLSTIKKFDVPLERATTSSIDALKAYSLGRQAMLRGDWASAVPRFERAIHIDPEFAMAYARLGTCYRLLGEVNLASENTRRAYDLRERTSDLEQFYVESHYFQQTTGELEKARKVYELWGATYPRDWSRPSAETAVSSLLGRYDDGLAESREELRLNPTAEGYADLIYFDIKLDRFVEAESAAKEAQANGFGFLDLHDDLYALDFLRNDATGMTREVEWSVGKPEWEHVFLAWESRTAAYFGKLGQARNLSRRAVTKAEETGSAEVAAGYEAEAALRAALFGYPAEARSAATHAMNLSRGRDVEFTVALTFGFAGDLDRARALANDLAARFPKHTIVQSNYLPTIQALLELRSDASKSIDTLQTAGSYELCPDGGMYLIYLRGNAYLSAHRGKEAVAEFQKILNHRGIILNQPLGAFAHLQIGRAYELLGDKANAAGSYQDFLDLWKNADSDIPALKQAKAEFAKMN